MSQLMLIRYESPRLQFSMSVAADATIQEQREKCGQVKRLVEMALAALSLPSVEPEQPAEETPA